MQISIEEIFEVFLFAAPGLGFAKLVEHQFLQVLEANLAFLDVLAVTAVKRRVAIRHELLEFAFLEDLPGQLERQCVRACS
jgi:hypothetical protein